MRKAFPIILRWFELIIGLFLVFWMFTKSNETPVVEKGHSKVVTDAESYARNTAVTDAAATDTYIFLNHGQDGVVSVYSWDGTYCFTIVTSTKGNGVPELYCVDSILYLIDKNNHVFLYDGAQLIQDFQIKTLEQGSKLRAMLRSNSSYLVSMKEMQIVDAEGNVVFSVSNTRNRLLMRSISFIPLSIIVLYVFFQTVVHGHRGLDRSIGDG